MLRSRERFRISRIILRFVLEKIPEKKYKGIKRRKEYLSKNT